MSAVTMLQSELQTMVKTDQEPRADWAAAVANKDDQQQAEALKRMGEVDRRALPRLKAIIEEFGWPGYSLAGYELDGKIKYSNMWLLVQHQDLEFQKLCLPLLKKAVEQQEASFHDYAYLLDRVRMYEQQPQVYGTQWKQSQTGKYFLYQVEDSEHLDDRRKEAGLSSSEEYKRGLMEHLSLTESDFE